MDDYYAAYESLAELEVGGLTGVLGLTGSGKTTLLRAFERVGSGLNEEVRLAANSSEFLPGLTVFEYLMNGCRLSGAKNCLRKCSEIIWLLGLDQCKNYLVASDKDETTISQGQRARTHIGFVIASASCPIQRLLIDEPLSSLDTGAAVLVVDAFKTLIQHGKYVRSIVFTDSPSYTKDPATELYLTS
ncbi:hypothetical protein GNI_135690 [Gregarina niphandrodes]|uniref:ABC transporter domain-containing protein n=1 Tax=Gregarina niphandrodes TaxID=110365 RepID=A0A023B0V1_GRENI|nr:hypothetical protein GNI_135690 [Gregarina niphandrodes]EZG46017.1 hypothetical protein GNI_135690 [Gregarina niphandrodes]|eukprot:XP_011132391.1 hypothetical protein GNI_135690 [Gregarina niphandrodes]